MSTQSSGNRSPKSPSLIEKQICDMYVAGITSYVIYKRFKIDGLALRSILEVNDIPIRDKLPKLWPVEILKEYEAGVPISEICTKYGISTHTMSNIAERYELHRIQYYKYCGTKVVRKQSTKRPKRRQ